MKPRNQHLNEELMRCKCDRHTDKRKKQKHKERDLESVEIRSYKHRKKEEYERSYKDS